MNLDQNNYGIGRLKHNQGVSGQTDFGLQASLPSFHKLKLSFSCVFVLWLEVEVGWPNGQHLVEHMGCCVFDSHDSKILF